MPLRLCFIEGVDKSDRPSSQRDVEADSYMSDRRTPEEIMRP
jgi:hypothetical protein